MEDDSQRQVMVLDWFRKTKTMKTPSLYSISDSFVLYFDPITAKFLRTSLSGLRLPPDYDLCCSLNSLNTFHEALLRFLVFQQLPLQLVEWRWLDRRIPPRSLLILVKCRAEREKLSEKVEMKDGRKERGEWEVWAWATDLDLGIIMRKLIVFAEMDVVGNIDGIEQRLRSKVASWKK